MNPEESRTKRRAVERPLPPVRTLRGDIHAPAAPSGDWIAPVRSGRTIPPQAPTAAVSADATGTGPLPGLQPLAQPLAGETAPLPVGTWTDLSGDETDELILEDEVFWVGDPDSVADELAHGDAIEPIEGLTVAGDIARTERTLDAPPVSAWDLTAARPATQDEQSEQEDWEQSGWDVLSRAFSDTGFDLEPEAPAPEPEAESVQPAGTRPAVAPAADPDALASRLERLAGMLRAGGTDALDPARVDDPLEAELAATLAKLLARRTD